MNYSLNSKNRKLKYRIHLIFDRLSFNFFNFTLSQRITFIGAILSFFPLFLSWFSIEDDNVKKISAFSINTGYIGYIVVVVLLFLLFILLSSKNKERLKTKANIIFHDYTIIIFSGILILALTIVTLNSIMGFARFYKGVFLGRGGILEIIGAIFVLVGGILSYKESKSDVLKKVYIENSKIETQADIDEYRELLNSEKTQNKSNMSLPI